MVDNLSGQAGPLTDDEEAIFAEAATRLGKSIGEVVPLRDYLASVATVASALGSSRLSELAGRF